MVRVKRGVTTKKKHKKIMKAAKGMQGVRRHRIKAAKEALMKAGMYAYRDRRAKKREARSLWIIRLNAAVRGYNLSYSKFVAGLRKAKIELDRRILADLAVNEPEVFRKIVEKIRDVKEKEKA